MATQTNTQKNASGVRNYASGRVVTDSATAAAKTFTLGFKPRRIKFHNVTDRISDEWFDGMEESTIYTAFLATTALLDADAGVTATDFGSTCNPTGEITLENLRLAIAALAAKLDADASAATTTYYLQVPPQGATAADLRAAMAAINALLDADTGVTTTTYASGTNPSAYSSLHTVAAGTRTLDITNGIKVDGNTFSVTATTMVASKVFFWEAFD